MILRLWLLAALAVGIALPAAARQGDAASAPKLVMEEAMVPTRDPGISVYVRNKRPAGMKNFSPERTILFVHGSTYPAETAFDLKLDGTSWMEYIAQRGYDVWLVDLRGYGKSVRPNEMSEPADKNEPIVRTATAVKDVGTAVDHILARRKLTKLNLLGWSWGTTIMATYATENIAKVNRVVLYAPQWLRDTPSLTAQPGPLGAYRTVKRDQTLARWLTGVPEDKKKDLIPAGWFDIWADATFASDPDGAKMNPPVLRAPNGTVADSKDFWQSGKPVYDPAKITVPILLIGAEWDQDTPVALARTLYSLLVNAPEKRLVTIGEGTHTVIMEKNRMQLFREVQLFFDEGLKS